MPSCSASSKPAVVARLRAAGCVFAEDEARLIVDSASTQHDLEGLIVRRVAGEPLEYVLGGVQFCGLRIGLDPGVFIPRQRTEFLVREAAALTESAGVVLDLCCGSGAIGLALTSMIGECELHAADIEPAAVRCAQRNLQPIAGRVYESDLFQGVPTRLRGQVDVLVANIPYVPSDAIGGMPVEAREYEPVITHDGGPDGLDVLRRMLATAPCWLAPQGHLLVEIYRQQTNHARQAFADAGLAVRFARSRQYQATIAIGTPPRT